MKDSKTSKETSKPKKEDREKLEEKCKMYFKAGNSTMLFSDDLQEAFAKLLEKQIRKFAKKYNAHIKGKFIYTR